MLTFHEITKYDETTVRLINDQREKSYKDASVLRTL